MKQDDSKMTAREITKSRIKAVTKKHRATVSTRYTANSQAQAMVQLLQNCSTVRKNYYYSGPRLEKPSIQKSK